MQQITAKWRKESLPSNMGNEMFCDGDKYIVIFGC